MTNNKPSFQGTIGATGGRIEVNVTLCSRSDVAEFIQWLNAFSTLLPEAAAPTPTTQEA